MIPLTPTVLALITPHKAVPLAIDTPIGRAVYVGGLPDVPRYTLHDAVWILKWNGVLTYCH